MQIKKFLFALLVVSSSCLNARTLSLHALKADFLEKTGLVEGSYEKVAGDPDCLEGGIEVLQIEGRKFSSLTLMLGGKTLVTTIGPGQVDSKERAFQTHVEASYADHRVDFYRSMTKPGTKFEFSIVVTVNLDGSIQYVQNNKTNGKASVENRVCKYRVGTDSEEDN